MVEFEELSDDNDNDSKDNNKGDSRIQTDVTENRQQPTTNNQYEQENDKEEKFPIGEWKELMGQDLMMKVRFVFNKSKGDNG